MYDFLQQIINGLALGSIYAMIAIGYTMVYGIIGLINFAHGEIYMLGAFTSIVALVAMPMLGITWLPLVLLLALILAVLITCGYGLSLERLATSARSARARRDARCRARRCRRR